MTSDDLIDSTGAVREPSLPLAPALPDRMAGSLAENSASPRGRSLQCGSRIALYRTRELELEFGSPSESDRVLTCRRGEQRAIWHGSRRAEVSNVRRGTVTIIPANERGRMELHQDAEFVCIHLAPALQMSCVAEAGHHPVPALSFRLGAFDPRAAAIIDLLSDSLHQCGPYPMAMLQRGCELLYLHLLRHYSTLLGATHDRRRGLADWHLRKIAEFVEPRLASPIGLDDLAAQVGLSRFHFCTAFKQATGVTPHEWLTIRRLDRAATSLSESNMSIAEIAFSVGYETSSSFSACFKRHMGTTPTAYRRRPAGARLPIHGRE